MIEKIPHTKATSFQYWQLDSPFEMWFGYRLWYWPKVLANMGSLSPTSAVVNDRKRTVHF